MKDKQLCEEIAVNCTLERPEEVILLRVVGIAKLMEGALSRQAMSGDKVKLYAECARRSDAPNQQFTASPWALELLADGLRDLGQFEVEAGNSGPMHHVRDEMAAQLRCAASNCIRLAGEHFAAESVPAALPPEFC